MAGHNETGKKGELLAAIWLKANGYEILFVNWRYSHYEIDIIATRNGILHFIEVKTRKTTRFGYPEDDVSKKKFASLLNAGEEFLYQYPGWTRVQYDVLSITIVPGQSPEYYLIEDVYHYDL